MKRKAYKDTLLALGTMATVLGSLTAQDGTNDSEIFELSPFEVVT